MNWPVGWTSLEPLAPEAFEAWRAGQECWWLEEPVPRTATGVADRVARLKALGNGQVPLCAATAWRLLSER